MFFIQKTSRLAGGFNFVRIDLKLSVKVGTIFLRLGIIIFSFKWDFWRRRKCPRRLLHEGGLSGPKHIRQKYLMGFWYLTRLLVETKKLLTTDISNSVFISSWKWEAVIFPLERSRPMSGQIKINNAQCITVSVNGPLISLSVKRNKHAKWTKQTNFTFVKYGSQARFHASDEELPLTIFKKSCAVAL